MNTLAHVKTKIPLSEIRNFLTQNYEQTTIAKSDSIIRIQTAIEPINILNWLAQQNTEQKVYFSTRDGDFEAGGVGIADIITSRKAIRAEYKDIRYYGGHAFSPYSTQPDWQELGCYRFILPRFEIYRQGKRTYLACHIRNDQNFEGIFEEIQSLRFENIPYPVNIPVTKRRTDNPDETQWIKMFNKVMADIQNNKYRKLVLARQSLYELRTALNPFALFGKLKSLTPECFHFLIQTSAHTTFLGASPERLFKRTGLTIESEAVAGTRPRDDNTIKDQQLSDELIRSVKENHEHDWVVKAIEKILKKHCRSVQSKPRNLVKFSWGQHLVSLFTGELNPGVTDTDLLETLHPTPAVGSYPTDQADGLFKKYEPFDRGWYAAPVGFLGVNHSEFAVAIRSALVKDNKIFVFAGAGIVQGSTAQSEWEEIENKIKIFKQIFGDGIV